MNTLAIRIATPADADAVQSIKALAYEAAYLARIGYVPKPGHEDYRPRIATRQVYLIAEANLQVGVLVLEKRSDHLLVYSLAVLPAAQGRGFGRKLLVFADEFAAAAGFSEIRLFTNARMTNSMRLYCNCGFREVGRRSHPSRAGETLVDFVKTGGEASVSASGAVT